MPSVPDLLLFSGAAFLLAIMPGPGLFYVAGRTLAAGRADGIGSCVGTGLGGLVHVLAGAVGLSALVVASTAAFTVVKLVGGLYLVWLGIQTWRSAGAPGPLAGAGPGSRAGAVRAVRQGLLVEATKPKTAAFFLALIPQFVDPDRGSIAVQFAVFGSMSIAMNTAVAIVAVALATRLRDRLASGTRTLARLQRGSGAVLVGLGASLLAARRPA